MSKRKRMTRTERKEEILRVLREGGDEWLTCRQIAKRMNLKGYSYVNDLLRELCDDGMLEVDVKTSRKAISNVKFEYRV